MATDAAIGARRQLALERFGAAEARIRAALDIPQPEPALPVASHDQPLKHAMQLERQADFLERVAEWVAPAVDAGEPAERLETLTQAPEEKPDEKPQGKRKRQPA